ncbi:MAG TPA: hypothetical protein VHJ79_10285, partial [Mycobacterium sp.]|nr:hypothetical protein [Mycobacterium sp.]
APHLHFQLSDGPEITTSNSLPLSLDSYWLAGAVEPAQFNDAADGKGVALPLRVIGPGVKQSGTFPLMYTLTSLGL